MNDDPPPRPYESYLDARKAYAEDFNKTVLPTIQVGQSYIESQTAFAKLAISYLFLANGGGLAGLLAIQPLVRDLNQTWLQQAAWIGSIFGVGLFSAAVCAALFYLNHSLNASAMFTKSSDDDLWLKHWYFDVHKPTTQQMSAANQDALAAAGGKVKLLDKLAVAFTLVSAIASVAGGISLAYSLFALKIV